MIILFLTIISSLFFTTTTLCSHEDYIEKEEYQAWVIYKINENELYVAKEFRYNQEPIHWGFKPLTGKILSPNKAEKLWERYDAKLQHEANANNDDA